MQANEILKSLRVLFPAPWGVKWKSEQIYRLGAYKIVEKPSAQVVVKIPRFRGTRKSTNGRGLAPGMFIKIAKNIKKASEQIKKRIGRKPSTKLMGLVAANVTDLVSSPSFLSPDSPKAATELHRTLANKFLNEQFRELTPKSTSKRLLGSMVEFSAMWYLSEHSPVSGLAYTRHTNFIQLAKPEILEALAPRICNQDIVI